MTMHMAHPSLTTGDKRKGKIKFRNSQEAQRARQLQTEWTELQKKWNVDAEDKKRNRAMSAEPLVYNLSAPVGRSTSTHLPSRNTGEAGTSTYKASPQYTGSAMLGVSQMSKSNAVPVFNSDHIVEIARMRRG